MFPLGETAHPVTAGGVTDVSIQQPTYTFNRLKTAWWSHLSSLLSDVVFLVVSLVLSASLLTLFTCYYSEMSRCCKSCISSCSSLHGEVGEIYWESTTWTYKLKQGAKTTWQPWNAGGAGDLSGIGWSIDSGLIHSPGCLIQSGLLTWFGFLHQLFPVLFCRFSTGVSLFTSHLLTLSAFPPFSPAHLCSTCVLKTCFPFTHFHVSTMFLPVSPVLGTKLHKMPIST